MPAARNQDVTVRRREAKRMPSRSRGTRAAVRGSSQWAMWPKALATEVGRCDNAMAGSLVRWVVITPSSPRGRPSSTPLRSAGILLAEKKRSDIVRGGGIRRAFAQSAVWVELLLDKFLYYRPTYRLLQSWQALGLDLPMGTVTDGLQRLLPLFVPVYEALIEHNQKGEHWHADETRWLVFATVEGKTGHRWTLWVFHSEDAVVFVLDSGRAHDVPEEHLG